MSRYSVGELGNLALQLLGLRPIKSSLWNFAQDLVTDEESAAPSMLPSTIIGSMSYNYGDDLSDFVWMDAFVLSKQPPTPSGPPPKTPIMPQL